MKDSKIINEMILHLNSFFSLLTEEELIELRENVSVERFKKNEIIYRDGDVPQYMHCLVSGKMKLYKEGVGNRTQIMRVMKPVQFFGYRAYFTNQNYINSAGAFENCIICLIPMELVEKWMLENNDIAVFFVRLLATELGISDERTVNLTQKHLRGRLAESLVFLNDIYGIEEDGSLSITISREDLANLSNMTTSNSIRTLSAFQDEGLLTIDGKRIIITNIEGIKKISKIG